MPRQLIQIPIGDWSNDGHGKCDWFIVSYNAEVDFTIAFMRSAKDHPELRPDKFCDRYEDSVIPDAVLEACEAAGGNIEELFEIEEWHGERYYHLDSERFAQYTLWFMNLSNPTLDAKLAPENNIPRWNPNWAVLGAREQLEAEGLLEDGDAGIGYIGYGIFY